MKQSDKILKVGKMEFEKFKSEVETLKKFFSIYCENNHFNQQKRTYKLSYQNQELNFDIFLCDECNNLFNYAINQLQNCPHNPKPKCRNCQNPCYEKDKYKKMAKIMRYSGMKLGLTKAAKKLKKFLKID